MSFHWRAAWRALRGKPPVVGLCFTPIRGHEHDARVVIEYCHIEPSRIALVELPVKPWRAVPGGLSVGGSNSVMREVMSVERKGKR